MGDEPPKTFSQRNQNRNLNRSRNQACKQVNISSFPSVNINICKKTKEMKQTFGGNVLASRY